MGLPIVAGQLEDEWHESGRALLPVLVGKIDAHGCRPRIAAAPLRPFDWQRAERELAE